MVVATLEDRKSKTRRIIKPQPAVIDGVLMHHVAGSKWESGLPYRCRYGIPGDRLWVRETFGVWRRTSYEYDEYEQGREALCGMTLSEWKVERGPQELQFCYRADSDDGDTTWFPSIHMPRWASRILLEIADVCAQRLQDMTAIDALDEGVMSLDDSWIAKHFPVYASEYETWKRINPINIAPPLGPGPLQRFKALWESINGKDSWDLNPLVWCISFKRMK